MGVKSSDEITIGFIVDIVDTVTYYKMQDASMDPPDAPTDETPTGWSTTEPEYEGESEQKLYSVTKTTFTDGTFSYSEVSLSSSFKAANQALVKALLAQNTASDAKNAASAAQATANQAQSSAAAAKTTADQAKTAAEGAAEDAAAAQATANQAQTTAEDASKVATNFLAFEEGTGLIVGDMTEDTLGANTLISANGVAIRNGDTELAKFGPNSVELGKNNANAEIRMRNDQLVIQSAEDPYRTVDGVQMNAFESSLMLSGSQANVRTNSTDAVYSEMNLYNGVPTNVPLAPLYLPCKNNRNCHHLAKRGNPYQNSWGMLEYEYTCMDPTCGQTFIYPKEFYAGDPDDPEEPGTTINGTEIGECPNCHENTLVTSYPDSSTTSHDCMNCGFWWREFDLPGNPAMGGAVATDTLDIEGIRIDAARSKLRPTDEPVPWGTLDFYKHAIIDLENIRASGKLYSRISLIADDYRINNPSAFMKALSAGKYAAISVSYPTGAYCYCENEELDILYEATDTVGEYTFSIPEEALGTWKITVVMEDNTMVRTVTLSEDNRTAHLYMPAFIPLYVDGVLTEEYGAFAMTGYKHTTNTGDWNGFTLTITNTDGVMDLKYTRNGTNKNQSSGYATFNRPIDLTHVKRIAIKLSSIPGNTPRLRIYQTLANGTGVASALLNAVYTELDVSAWTGSYYVTLALQGSTNTTHFYVEDWRLIM